MREEEEQSGEQKFYRKKRRGVSDLEVLQQCNSTSLHAVTNLKAYFSSL